MLVCRRVDLSSIDMQFPCSSKWPLSSYFVSLHITSWMTFTCISWCKYSWACSSQQQQMKLWLGNINATTTTTKTTPTRPTTTTTTTTTPACVFLWGSTSKIKATLNKIHGVNLKLPTLQLHISTARWSYEHQLVALLLMPEVVEAPGGVGFGHLRSLKTTQMKGFGTTIWRDLW